MQPCARNTTGHAVTVAPTSHRPLLRRAAVRNLPRNHTPPPHHPSLPLACQRPTRSVHSTLAHRARLLPGHAKHRSLPCLGSLRRLGRHACNQAAAWLGLAGLARPSAHAGVWVGRMAQQKQTGKYITMWILSSKSRCDIRSMTTCTRSTSETKPTNHDDTRRCRYKSYGAQPWHTQARPNVKRIRAFSTHAHTACQHTPHTRTQVHRFTAANSTSTTIGALEDGQ